MIFFEKARIWCAPQFPGSNFPNLSRIVISLQQKFGGESLQYCRSAQVSWLHLRTPPAKMATESENKASLPNRPRGELFSAATPARSHVIRAGRCRAKTASESPAPVQPPCLQPRPSAQLATGPLLALGWLAIRAAFGQQRARPPLDVPLDVGLRICACVQQQPRRPELRNGSAGSSPSSPAPVSRIQSRLAVSFGAVASECEPVCMCATSEPASK